MSTSLRPLTTQHIESAQRMPRKGIAKMSKKWRKTIADYYRAVRKESPNRARRLHRERVVNSPTEAKIRLKNMTA